MWSFGLNLELFMAFPRVVLFRAVRLTSFLGIFSKHLPGAWLGVVGNKRTKMSRILSLASWRVCLAVFWKELPPLWEFQGEERQG